MEAKDTVINRGKMVDGGHVESLLREQAEVSFKAGYEAGWQGERNFILHKSDSRDFGAGIYAGRKEVVNWVYAHANGSRIQKITTFIPISEIDFEVAQKEWGIEQTINRFK
jgi:hypothetical protein